MEDKINSIIDDLLKEVEHIRKQKLAIESSLIGILANSRLDKSSMIEYMLQVENFDGKLAGYLHSIKMLKSLNERLMLEEDFVKNNLNGDKQYE